MLPELMACNFVRRKERNPIFCTLFLPLLNCFERKKNQLIILFLQLLQYTKVGSHFWRDCSSFYQTYSSNQGCGSGSGLDPDLETLWIRIRIGNPDPDPGARKLRNFSGKNALFSYLKQKFTTKKQCFGSASVLCGSGSSIFAECGSGSYL
jgi:hypothetical protein